MSALTRAHVRPFTHVNVGEGGGGAAGRQLDDARRRSTHDVGSYSHSHCRAWK